MVIDKVFIDGLHRVCSSIEESRGSLNLFAVLKMDELTDKWTVVISANWVSNDNFEAIFAELRALLIENVEDYMESIARLGIFTLDNHLSEIMIHRYSSGDIIQEDEKINGNLVHEGYIIKVLKTEQSSPILKQQ
jgi:hypothetical protein